MPAEMDATLFPPFAAENEGATDDPALHQECLAAIEDLRALGLVARTTSITRNSLWGAVLRMDFTIAEFPDVNNKLVCWRSPDGAVHTAIGVE